jgi:phosphonate transport system substrate-binding protein
VLGMPAIEVAGFGKLSHFEAIAPADFQVVRDMVKELGLKKEQLK